MQLAHRVTSVFSGLLLAALVGCASTAQHEGTGEYIDDTVITGKVKAALVADPELKAHEINVETYKGTVQLSGFVAQPDHIPKAVNLTRGVRGVKAVKNDILVKR